MVIKPKKIKRSENDELLLLGKLLQKKLALGELKKDSFDVDSQISKVKKRLKT